jgi:hypothetical protein
MLLVVVKSQVDTTRIKNVNTHVRTRKSQDLSTKWKWPHCWIGEREMTHSFRTVQRRGLPAKVGTTWTPAPRDNTASTSCSSDGRGGGGGNDDDGGGGDASILRWGTTERRGDFLRAGLRRGLGAARLRGGGGRRAGWSEGLSSGACRFGGGDGDSAAATSLALRLGFWRRGGASGGGGGEGLESMANNGRGRRECAWVLWVAWGFSTWLSFF